MSSGETPENIVEKPTDPCAVCLAKHFAAAMRLYGEIGYRAVNRLAVIGELELARWHAAGLDAAIASGLRELRHAITLHREAEIGNAWETISELIDFQLSKIKTEEK